MKHTAGESKAEAVVLYPMSRASCEVEAGAVVVEPMSRGCLP
jgi:hypothetical protein